jgi:glyceraldehyde 3-phosphate dehydrogenase (phosphorylating)
MARFAINGFGRIGRNILRAALKRGANLDVVLINDVDKPKTLAHLFKYDSVHGIFDGTVQATEDAVVINGKRIAVSAKRDPSELAHKEHGVDVALECSGRFTNRPDAEKHLKAGARKVIISAPGKGQDLTVCYGINHEKYDPAKHNVISNASCTTNGLAPVAKVLHELAGIERGLMTTIHAYTADQNLLDLPHRDMRRARAAAINLIPASTGAAKAVGLVLPELKGKLTGFAVRAPVPTGSVVDLTADVSRETSVEEINEAFKAQADTGALEGILRYTDDPIVSSDIVKSTHSSIFDSQLTLVLDGTMVKVVAWYDNEWGYSNRCVELAQRVLVHAHA